MPLIETEGELEEILSRPSARVVQAVKELEGDILILGAGGKMGPGLAQMVKRAADKAGSRKRVVAVSRFSSPGLEQKLRDAGVKTIACDLLDPDSLKSLPDAPNVIFMAGRKFGSAGNEALTWAMNTHLPGMVVQRFRHARIVVFSTGNVYPLVPIDSGGADESHPTGPIGEYAQSCLGRERIVQHFCSQFGISCILIRLNYAVEPRYGVLTDVAQNVYRGEPIGLRMGYVNVIWQADVNNATILALSLCENPPRALNVTGPEVVSLRWLALRLGELLGRKPVFKYKESKSALLSNAAQYVRLLGPPAATIEQMVQWVAHWILTGGPVWEKPTHFQRRNGRF